MLDYTSAVPPRPIAAAAPRLRACVAAAGLMMAVVPPAAAQRDWSQVEIKTTPVADGVYLLEGPGGNIGVCAGEDGVFVIDDQFAPLTEKILAAIAAISDTPVRFVLNTHWHGDHTGGNENFGKAGVTIIAHDNVRKTMSADQVSASGRAAPASPRAALPIVTFADTITFHMNGQTVRALHVPPAHTDGDAIVHFMSTNVIHSGDVVFNGFYPVIDSGHGGSLAGMIAATERVMAMCDAKTKVIPGHGPLTDRAGVKAFHDMLVEVEARLAKLARVGTTLEEAKAAKPLADLDEAWGSVRGSDRFIEMAYPTVRGAKP